MSSRSWVPQNANPANNLGAAPSRLINVAGDGMLIKTARGDFRSLTYTMNGTDALPIQADEKRNYLVIQNTSNAASIRVAFGTIASVNNGFILGPTAQWVFDTIPVNEISLFGPAGVNVQIVLGTDAGEGF